MKTASKVAGEIVMHMATVLAILFALAIMFDVVKAHPANSACHKHGAVVHCK